MTDSSVTLSDRIAASEVQELELYETATTELYEDAWEFADELVEYAFDVTNNFSDIDWCVIQEHPRIVRVCRYVLGRTKSRNRFSQLIGGVNVKAFEEGRRSPSRETAEKIASYVCANVHETQLPWVVAGRSASSSELSGVKRMLKTLIAEAETGTAYRTWRKNRQEGRVQGALEAAGYTELERSEAITSVSDVGVGEYCTETKVAGHDRQKADFIFRPNTDQLVFVEAKACGFRIDSDKRQKEIRNKKSDWLSEFPECRMVAVVGGVFKEEKIESLAADGVGVFWEHALDSFRETFEYSTVDADVSGEEAVVGDGSGGVYVPELGLDVDRVRPSNSKIGEFGEGTNTPVGKGSKHRD